MPTTRDVRETALKYLSSWRGRGRREIAFYGGTFTALARDLQEEYLKAAFEFVQDGRVHGLRVSTRPDCISEDAVALLKKYTVETVELGAQSMSDEVLRLSGRGHLSVDTANAVKMLKANVMTVGVQLMPGLPGDTVDSIIESAQKVAALTPDFVRVSPTVVIKDTPLYEMYADGRYRAWELNGMVDVCRAVCRIFKEARIPVVRIGLHWTDDLAENLVAGPVHPSFAQLVTGT